MEGLPRTETGSWKGLGKNAFTLSKVVPGQLCVQLALKMWVSVLDGD